METRHHDQAYPPGRAGPARRPQPGVAGPGRSLQHVQAGPGAVREADQADCAGACGAVKSPLPLSGRRSRSMGRERGLIGLRSLGNTTGNGRQSIWSSYGTASRHSLAASVYSLFGFRAWVERFTVCRSWETHTQNPGETRGFGRTLSRSICVYMVAFAKLALPGGTPGSWNNLAP